MPGLMVFVMLTRDVGWSCKACSDDSGSMRFHGPVSENEMFYLLLSHDLSLLAFNSPRKSRVLGCMVSSV